MNQLMKCGLTVLLLALLVTAGSAQLSKMVLNNPVTYGDMAHFRISLVNDLGGDLIGVKTVDPLVPACSNDWWGNIPSGQTVFYDCYAPVTQSFVNTITATGVRNGNNFRLDASAQVIMTCSPAFTVSLEPNTQDVAYGGTATWTVTVKNTGTCPLANVFTTDVNTAVVAASPCAQKIGSLDVGKSSSFTCSQGPVTADFKKVISAYATDPFGTQASTFDDATVKLIPCYPGISIVGTPAAQFVHSGGTAKWSITVTNTGDKALSGVAVSGTVCKKTIGNLAVGAKSTYSCSKSGYVRGTKNNMYTYPLTSKGTACGMTVSAKDTLWVTVKPAVVT
jgi:uncharacterized repeat protein (TIGR01451 family)